jgi:hypothetical protein
LIDVNRFIDFWKKKIFSQEEIVKSEQVNEKDRIAFSVSDPTINLNLLPRDIDHKEIVNRYTSGYIVLNERRWILIHISLDLLRCSESLIKVLSFNQFASEATVRFLRHTSSKSSKDVVIINDNDKPKEVHISITDGEIRLPKLKPLKVII